MKYSLGRPTFRPFTPLPRSAPYSGTGLSTEVESMGSCPEMTCRRRAASSTFQAKGPIWSREEAKATRPKRDTRPYVGLSPTTPQQLAGWRMEPPVSDPRARGARRAATAAALPPEEPPGMRPGSQGLRVVKKAEFSVEEPMANSSRFVLPMRTAPAAFSFWMTVASYGAV